jgi:tRNA(Ile)-lysidine synthase
MDLLDDFFKFIKTMPLSLDNGNRTLLAVSGGLDSIVMAHLFHKAKLPFAIAHCNFQLREQESDGDELFVQKIALGFEVPFFVKRFETSTYAEENGCSIQMAARELRYAWFSKIATENGFDFIAVAQHLNDAVETALLNFVRGTGLSGLIGIRPAPLGSEKRVIRPLLFASRHDILEYSLIHEITWQEDSSNASDDYARNFVRHHVVPKLEALNPNFLRTAERNMGRIGAAKDNLTFLLNNWLEPAGHASSESYNKTTVSVEIKKIAQLPSPQQALVQFLKPYGFDTEQARQLAENLDHVGLELHSDKGFSVLIDRTKMLISAMTGQAIAPPTLPIQADDLMIRLPDGSRLFLMEVADQEFPVNASTDTQSIVLNAEKLKFPLHLRHWQPGDSFQPLGMGGKSQKLQDFFTNQKLSRFEKEAVWLLVNGNDEVVWLLGWRMDERFKLHLSTNTALKINWIK